MSSFKGIIIKRVTVLLIAIFVTGILIGTANCRAQEKGIYINEIKISDSRILVKEEIEKWTTGYENKTVTVPELKELVARINELYNSKGYITARAILPKQTVENGIVKIELVEGTIGGILLEENKNTKNNYILKRISYNTGDIIQTDILENELSYFNATNDIRLQAELKAGQNYGTTDLKLKVREPKNYQITLFTDNTGREETGHYRYGIELLNRSLTGYRDSFNLTAFGAKGAQGGSMSYSVPLTRTGTRLILNYNNNVTDVISGEYESVNIEGNYEDYGLGFSRPLLVKNGLKVDGSIEYKNKISDTYFSGVNLLTTDIETYNLGLSTQSVKKGVSWNNSCNIMIGSASSGKDDYDDPGTTDNFNKYTAYLENQRILGDKSIFNFRCYLQGTNNKLLPSSEQFSLGGMSTVRGYEEGKLTGDQGYFLSIELSKAVSEKLSFFIFLDHGGVFPYKGNEEGIDEEDYLTGIGSGYNINFTESISGEFLIGVPFFGEDEPLLHFSMQKVW